MSDEKKNPQGVRQNSGEGLFKKKISLLWASLQRFVSEKREDIIFQQAVKQQLLLCRKVDKKTLSIAIDLVKAIRSDLKDDTKLKEVLANKAEIAAILDKAYQTRATAEDGFERKENIKRIEELSKERFVSEDGYLKGACKNARKSFLKKFDEGKMDFEEAVKKLNDADIIKKLVDEAEAEILHTNSSPKTVIKLGILTGVVIWVSQGGLSKLIPSDESLAIKEIQDNVKDIKKEQETLGKAQAGANEAERRTLDAIEQKVDELQKKLDAREEGKTSVLQDTNKIIEQLEKKNKELEEDLASAKKELLKAKGKQRDQSAPKAQKKSKHFGKAGQKQSLLDYWRRGKTIASLRRGVEVLPARKKLHADKALRVCAR